MPIWLFPIWPKWGIQLSDGVKVFQGSMWGHIHILCWRLIEPFMSNLMMTMMMVVMVVIVMIIKIKIKMMKNMEMKMMTMMMKLGQCGSYMMIHIRWRLIDEQPILNLSCLILSANTTRSNLHTTYSNFGQTAFPWNAFSSNHKKIPHHRYLLLSYFVF